MSLHPSSWIAWLTAICVLALAVTNPLYVGLAFAAVIVVHLSFPFEPSPVGRAVRIFVTLGLVLLFLRVVFVALLPNPGQTTLLSLPSVTTPRWLGGLDLGGDVSAEVIVGALSEGIRLILVLAGFGVFNARADLTGLVRAVPAAFRDAGLVVSIAIAFVPGVLRTVGDVRDAQRLRGEHGLRRLAPTLVVPILGMSLERALLLAESMDVRGYGRGGTSRPSRLWLWTGLTFVLMSFAAWVSAWGSAALAIAAVGAACIAWGFRTATSVATTSRLTGYTVRTVDIVIILASAAAVFLAGTAGVDAQYEPYPVVSWPPFSAATAAATLLLLAPALSTNPRR